MIAVTHPDSLKAHPRVGQWLAPAAAGRIRASSGKVDIGQGISHALRLMVAGELGLDIEQIEMIRPATDTSPDEAVTSGSLSIQHSGSALRAAAAHLREGCRERAAGHAGVPPGAVTLAGGVFLARTHRYAYADLIDAALLDEVIDPARQHLHPPAAGAQALNRPDVAAKVFGEFEYLHDMTLPGMVHGRVHHPATLAARRREPAWQPLMDRLGAMPGIFRVEADGLLLGVLASTEHALLRADRAVDAASLWIESADVPEPSGTGDWLRSQPLDTVVIAEQAPEQPPAAAHQVFKADYGRGWLQHASIGLCCAIARWEAGHLEVWSHTQGIFNLRRDLALAFGLPQAQVTVRHADGAGCYGHNGADDVAFDAAWLALQAGGRPVRVEWTRQQEMARAPLGPAMHVRVEAAVDAQGRLQSWTQEVWSQGHGTRPGRGNTPSLLGAWQVAQAAPVTMAVNAAASSGGGADRNAVPPYAVPGLAVRSHRVLAMPLRVSALRALGAHVNVLAAESMMDEIAQALGRDPLAYRLEHLADPRARQVLQEAARMAGWGTQAAAEGVGQGLAFARYKGTGAYCAVAVELAVEERVKLRRIFIAADIGRVVHPDGARNQLEGGAVQAASWTLLEAAALGTDGIRSVDWETYPILGFADTPAIEVSLLDRPNAPSLGAGECSVGPTAAAIANAIAQALGLRVRQMPFTADALMQAAQASA